MSSSWLFDVATTMTFAQSSKQVFPAPTRACRSARPSRPTGLFMCRARWAPAATSRPRPSRCSTTSAPTLKTAGSSLANAASITVYLKNQSDFAAMNEVYRTYWTKDPPARTTVVVPLAERRPGGDLGGRRAGRRRARRRQPERLDEVAQPVQLRHQERATRCFSPGWSAGTARTTRRQGRHGGADQDRHGQRRRGAQGRRHELRRRRQLAHLHHRRHGIPGHERRVPDLLSDRSAGARDGQGGADDPTTTSSRSRWWR